MKTEIKDTNEERVLTCYDFKRELLSIPSKSKKLKLSTAKKKVLDIFEKYDDLISYTREDKLRYQDRYFESTKVIQAMKKGIVEYEGGFFRVSEIERVKVTDKNVVVNFKSGTSDVFTNDFTWLIKLW